MRDALLDREEVTFLTIVPATKLGKAKEGGYDDEDDRCIPAGGSSSSVAGFGFRYRHGSNQFKIAMLSCVDSITMAINVGSGRSTVAKSPRTESVERS